MQSSRLGNYTIYYEHSEEFHELKREIFTTQIYYIELFNPAPVILDGGAHIGLSTLYFRQLCYQAKITAVEPLVENAVLLEKNLFENQITNVVTIHAALAGQIGSAALHYDSSDEGWFSTTSLYDGAWNGAQKTTARIVPTISLVSLLEQEQYDLVKLDIEGAELGVVRAASNILRAAENYLIEVHERKDNTAEQLEKIFSEQGFSTTLQQLSRAGLSLLHATKH
ncbi:MAG: FkbM family methyltransferase [Candidatus Pacebacteria bacterium]|nr:FkbM family methyltransferase [Candidatus Paceibacterota bacterium]PIR60388.1 MAG: hypothetical protein COU67_02430 [Candidatus Pacebacteria bacterium CG10_big_fil_rev_8_21_14_0_10_44_54]